MTEKLKRLTRNFFNKFFYRQHPEAALRYYPVILEIKRRNLSDTKILEIGSGSLGIIPYLKKPIDGIDIDFAGPKTKLLNKIKGKAYDLPFRKNSYDVTISVDVLEHIEKDLREKAVFQMLKVSKKLALIVVPCGTDSELQDKNLQIKWNRLFDTQNKFLEEHVKYGLPKTNEILIYIDRSLRKLEKNAKVTSYPNLNLKVRKFLMDSWITKSKFIYYFYLKGLLIFLPLLKIMNFGKTYRRVFVVEFQS